MPPRLAAVLCLALALPCALAAEPPPGTLTAAEASEYTQTATSDQVLTVARAIADASERVTLASLGTSGEGRDIPLLLLADPPVASLEDLRKDKRAVALLIGNIHAGEVCGKEALLALVRDAGLAAEPPAWLDGLVVAAVPNYNPDGNDRMAEGNRPGQVGPQRMGTRENAQGLDLNRDHVKLDAPETRALQRFLRRHDPAVVVDTHTTNGSHHRYTLTYQGPKHPAGDAQVISFVRDTMLPRVGRRLAETSNYDSFVYGNFEDRHTRWTTYPAEPRYGTAYRGMRNRISILSEAYAYAPLKDRVLATRAFCEAILTDTHEHLDEVRALLDAADERTRKAAGVAPLALRVEARPFPQRVTAKGFEAYNPEGEPLPEPGAPRDYEVELVNDFVPTLEVTRPRAYLIPPDRDAVIEMLHRHGVRVDELREDVEVRAEAYRIDAFEHSTRAFQGHHTVHSVDATALPQTVRLAAGWHVVPMDQPLGSLAGYLLEPQASDGLTAWNLFDEDLAIGGTFPVLRLTDEAPLLTRSAAPLDEDLSAPRPIRFDNLYGDRGTHDRVRIDGGSPGRLRWVDDDPEHYTVFREDRLWKVHATTGHAEPAQDEQTAVAARLAALDTIDTADAAGLARRDFAQLEPRAAGAVFEHGRDLYYADRDGSNPRRLTATPEEEEHASLAPGGRFVSFVRDNNLWVVDVQTGTERAITTEGTESHRFGKASWVYFEEVFGRNWNASWWSPDGRRLLFLETDDAATPWFSIIDNRAHAQREERVRYPKPGDPNPRVAAWIAPVDGGAPVPVDLGRYDPGRFLITQIVWSRDGGHARLAIQDRQQTWMDIVRVDPRTGATSVLRRETTDAWVEPIGTPVFLDDGSTIERLARDGWIHIYRFDKEGHLASRLTEGPWDVKSAPSVREDAGWVYFTASRDCFIADNAYRVPLDGGDVERLTSEPGDHAALVNADGSMFIDTWSALDTPARAALRNGRGSLLRTLDSNPVHERADWALGRIEPVRIESSKGVTLEGIMLYPPDFDPSLSYPAWLTTYGGPMAPLVRDAYRGGRTWERMLAQLGMVVLIADPHPASGKGPNSAWTAYKRLGVRELEDLGEIAAWLKAQPFVDPSRIGISGHSFGGFMTAFAMTHTDHFAAGIAGAPVTDWRLYDSIYTERYMLTPQDNPEGYAASSVLDAAGNLSGRLLILHGDMDDNVHLQNSLQLADALHREQEPFEMMVYPGYRHGLGGAAPRRLMAAFIAEHIVRDGPRRGPRPAPGEPTLAPEEAQAPPASTLGP